MEPPWRGAGAGGPGRLAAGPGARAGAPGTAYVSQRADQVRPADDRRPHVDGERGGGPANGGGEELRAAPISLLRRHPPAGLAVASALPSQRTRPAVRWRL